MKNDRKIQFCPKCGYIPIAKDYESDPGMAYFANEAVSGRFRCPECNYHGIALEAKEKDYKKLFPKKKD
jgi:hypothetical protein